MESNMAGSTYKPNSLSLTTSIPTSPSPIRAIYPEDARAAIEKMKKQLGMEDLHEFCLYPNIELPASFKLPKMEVFDGLGYPKRHLIMYLRTLKPIGLRDQHLVQLFQRTLTGSALRWFSQLKPSEIKTFDDIIELFMEHYKLNTLLCDNAQELQMVKQGPNEGFRAFIKRWNDKLTQLVAHPTEREQVRMIKKNLQARYGRLLCAITNLHDLVQVGMEVEEAFREGIFEGEEQGSTSKRRESPKEGGVNTISPTRPKRRRFASWGKPLSEVMSDMVQQGHLKPLEPSPVPYPPPKKYKPKQYCAFHQRPGHPTNNCIRLRHEVQDLVDAEIVTPPSKRRRSNP